MIVSSNGAVNDGMLHVLLQNDEHLTTTANRQKQRIVKFVYLNSTKNWQFNK